jgi:hypothetical protein
VFILLEFPSPSRRIFIGSHSLPPPPLWFAVSVLHSRGFGGRPRFYSTNTTTKTEKIQQIALRSPKQNKGSSGDHRRGGGLPGGAWWRASPPSRVPDLAAPKEQTLEGEGDFGVAFAREMEKEGVGWKARWGRAVPAGQPRVLDVPAASPAKRGAAGGVWADGWGTSNVGVGGRRQRGGSVMWLGFDGCNFLLYE